MKAQEIINEVEIENKKSNIDWIMRTFHYNFWIQEKTNENISIILTKLKQEDLKCLKTK